MLTRVLEVERYPFALVTVSDVVPGADDPPVNVAITLHGITRTTRIPVRIEPGNDEITVSGRVVLAQTDFGITPLSILGGAIQVEDEINLRFRIRVRRCFTQACR
jgi:polyisoprenoid-binding protein YceI